MLLGNLKSLDGVIAVISARKTVCVYPGRGYTRIRLFPGKSVDSSGECLPVLPQIQKRSESTWATYRDLQEEVLVSTLAVDFCNFFWS